MSLRQWVVTVPHADGCGVVIVWADGYLVSIEAGVREWFGTDAESARETLRNLRRCDGLDSRPLRVVTDGGGVMVELMELEEVDS